MMINEDSAMVGSPGEEEMWVTSGMAIASLINTSFFFQLYWNFLDI